MRLASLLAFVQVVVGCSGPSQATCVAGQSVACACSNARAGFQVCQPGGFFAKCSCDGEAVDSGSTSVDGGSLGGHPPVILTASVSQNARMTRGETVIISAVVTDPDGINDLIGGSLTDPTGHSTYGVFATSASEGAYSLTVSWSDFNHVSVIEFVNQEHRDAVMHFFDAEGHETKQTLSVTLHCDGAGGSACGGECKDLQTDENNCGRCNTQCVGGCTVGACLPRLEPAGAPSDNRSCDTACAKMKTPNGRALSCAAECPSANATVAGVATYRWQHNDWNKPVTTCDQNVPPAFYSDAFTSWALFELSCCCR